MAKTLCAFGGSASADEGVDERILAQLGEPTDAKKWLAVSLAKTIRLQLHPSPEMQALPALEGPAWIKQDAN